MRVLLFGASGMLGQGVLLECLDDPQVTHVLAVVRRELPQKHPKLEQLVHQDFADLSAIRPRLAGFDACFDCLGVSSAGLSEAEYTRQTYDITIAIGEAVAAMSPGCAFTYVSGTGTDSSEKGRTMWARVKGRTENKLLAMPFRGAYMFRPGFIQPERGVKSRTPLYRAVYVVLRPFAGLLTRGAAVTTTSRVGHAMLQLARIRPPSGVVEARQINELAAAYAKTERIARKEYA